MTTLHSVPSRNDPAAVPGADSSFDPPPLRTGPMGKAGSGAAPWDTEFPKDVWHARALGINARSQVTVHFENITRPWLRQLAKRWARWRLTTGLTIESAVLGTKAVEGFNAFLDSTRIPVTGTADIDREVIEGFLAYLHTHSAGAPSHRIRIGQFNTFLLTMRRHGWVSDLPSTAQIYTEDYPKETVRQPRALSEHVMAQLENPENLAKMASPHHRLITVILIRCGLRISDTVGYVPLSGGVFSTPCRSVI